MPRYSRVLLFRTDPSVQIGATLLPCGMGILAEILEEKGIDYEVMDMSIGGTEDDLMALVDEFRPDLVGCSMISYRYTDAYRACERIKEKYPGTTIACGGPHMSMFRERVLEACPAIDYGFTLEGEETFFELIEGKPVEEIQGVYRRGDDGEILFLGDRKAAKDLSVFPFPKYKKFDVEKYTPLVPIYSSRGCPYPCTFCAIKDVIGRKFRTKPVPMIADEIQYWYDRGIRKVSFSDDNFTMIPKRVFDLCDELEKRDMPDLNLQVWDTRADSTSRELLIRMKAVGFQTLLIGVESANNRVLKEVIKKMETIEEIEQMVKDATELGFDIRMSFIVGAPGDLKAGIQGETIEEVRNSFKFALSLPVKGASFFNPVPTPNTEFLRVLENTDRLAIDPEEYLNERINTQKVPLFETAEISFKDRRKLLREARRVEHKVVINYWLHKLGWKKYGIFGRLAVQFLMNPIFNEYLYTKESPKRLAKNLVGVA